MSKESGHQEGHRALNRNSEDIRNGRGMIYSKACETQQGDTYLD